SVPRYEEYKDSGVEWMGKVPSHWKLRKLKHIASFSGGGTPSRDNPSYWDGAIPWVSPKDMKIERITGTEEYITEEALRTSAAELVSAGALLLVVRSGILRHTIPAAINEIPVTLNQDMKAVRPASDICSSDFLLRWVQGLNALLLLQWSKQGATVESIEHDYLRETKLALPPL